MKKTKNISILLILATMVMMLASCSVVVNGNDYRPAGSLKLVRRTEYSVSDVQNIDFNLEVAAVKFLKSKTDKVEIVEYGTSRYSKAHYIGSRTTGGTLELYHSNSGVIWNNINSECIVYLPENYKGSIDFYGAVGGVTITDNFQISALDIDIEVGGVEIKNLAVQELNVNIEVGGISFGVPKGYSFNYEFEAEVGGISTGFLSGAEGSYGDNPTANVYLSAEVGGIEVYQM